MKSKEYFLLSIYTSLIVLLAFTSDWEYDESWTYNQVLKIGYWDIITYHKYNIANNHLLNSLFVKTIQLIGLKQQIWFRLLSIGSCILFFITNVRILQAIKINTTWILPIVFFTYLPYCHLARGYISSLTLLSLSFYYLFKYFKSQELKHEWLFIIFGSLASLGIISFFYGYASLILAYTIYKIASKQLLQKRLYIYFLPMVLLTTLYVYHIGKIVVFYDKSIAGGNALLKNGSLSSIIGDISFQIFFKDTPYSPYIRSLELLIIVLAVFLYLYIKSKSSFKFDIKNHNDLTAFLLIAIILLLWISHIALGAKYPYSRATYHLQYFLIMFIIFTINSYVKSKNLYFMILILIGPSLFREALVLKQLENDSFGNILLKTQKSNLYIFGHNQSFKLFNSLSNEPKNNIYQSENPETLNINISKDNTSPKYLYIDDTESSKISHKKQLLTRGRDNMVLYLVK